MGTFKCGKHDFTCDDLAVFQKHNEDEIHRTYGSAPCNLCGIKTKFNFTGKLKAGKFPALCDSCKSDLTKGDKND